VYGRLIYTSTQTIKLYGGNTSSVTETEMGRSVKEFGMTYL